MLAENPRKLGVWEELIARPAPEYCHLVTENERMAEVEWRREAQLIREAESRRDPRGPLQWFSILVVSDRKKKPMQQARELEEVPQKERKA